MQKELRKTIREMLGLLNDEALFHQRSIPGDQDDYEGRSTNDPGETRHQMYTIINNLISVYDAVGDDYSDPQLQEIIAQIVKDTTKLVNLIK